jgi:hypothetical protein
MAAPKRPVYPKFISPKASFVWPKLDEPDYKFAAEGKYEVKINLELADPVTQAFLKKLQPHYDAAIVSTKEEYKALPVAKRKELEAQRGGFSTRPLYKTLYDEETEKENGLIQFSFSMKASGIYRGGKKEGQTWTRKPVLFDAAGKPMLKAPKIWNGTVGKVGFEAAPSFMPKDGQGGLKLYLTSAQIIELRSGGERSASDYGFGAEDGYSHEDSDDDRVEQAEESFSDESGGDAGDMDGAF